MCLRPARHWHLPRRRAACRRFGGGTIGAAKRTLRRGHGLTSDVKRWQGQASLGNFALGGVQVGLQRALLVRLSEAAMGIVA